MFGKDTNKPQMRAWRDKTLNTGNACYHQVQYLSSASLLSKDTKTKHIQFCQWSYTGVKLGLWLEELRLRVSIEQNAMGDILCVMSEKVTRIWRKLPNQKVHNFYVAKYYSDNEMGKASLYKWKRRQRIYMILTS